MSKTLRKYGLFVRGQPRLFPTCRVEPQENGDTFGDTFLCSPSRSRTDEDEPDRCQFPPEAALSESGKAGLWVVIAWPSAVAEGHLRPAARSNLKMGLLLGTLSG